MGCKRVLSFSLCPPNLSYLLWSLFGSMAKRGLFLPRDTVFNYRTLAVSPQEYDWPHRPRLPRGGRWDARAVVNGHFLHKKKWGSRAKKP